MAKRYYWLQMKEDFFKDKRVKKLRKIAGGDTYTVIYLKMMLRSLENEGIIEFEGIEKTLADEIALDLDEDADNVQITLTYLMQAELLVDMGNNQFFLPFVAESLGSESASAKRVRDYRARQKALQCNTNVTQEKQNGNGEIDIDIDIDKDIYTTTTNNKDYSFVFRTGNNEHVQITPEDLQKLDVMFGIERVRLMIQRLDYHIEKTGTFYPNHFEVIKKWIEEDNKRLEEGQDG